MEDRLSSTERSALLAKLHADSLSEPEFAQLEQALTEDAEFRWQFIYDVHLRSGLVNWVKSHGVASEPSLIRLLEVESECGHDVRDSRTWSSDVPASAHSWSRRLSDAMSVTLLATLLCVFGVWGAIQWMGIEVGFPEFSFARDPSAPFELAENPPIQPIQIHNAFALGESQSVVARVVWATPDTIWSKDGRPDDFLFRLRPGNVIGIESGLAKIEFSDGALVLLNSPSLLQVTSATSARLMRGQVTGRAQNGNFTLSTPSATVVDIGTEFGVGVDDLERTAVTVFEGEVHVHGMLRRSHAGPLRRLTEGMSLNIDGKGATWEENSERDYRRDFMRASLRPTDDDRISLLNFIGGQVGSEPAVAASIDPSTGYWGRLPWADPNATRKLRGDTQYTMTGWNPVVDGVFIPRSNAREMQIDSDGHMVYLPSNSGETWGPIWTRRRPEFDSDAGFSGNRNDAWGNGKLNRVLNCLGRSQAGIMGLHANVGITFDLDALRSATGSSVEALAAGVANLGGSLPDRQSSETGSAALVDFRIFVDGKLRYSRVAFCSSDGEEPLDVAIHDSDRYVTIVVTDAGGDSSLDHVVLIDPFFHVSVGANSEIGESATDLAE